MTDVDLDGRQEPNQRTTPRAMLGETGDGCEAEAALYIQSSAGASGRVREEEGTVTGVVATGI